MVDKQNQQPQLSGEAEMCLLQLWHACRIRDPRTLERTIMVERHTLAKGTKVRIAHTDGSREFFLVINDRGEIVPITNSAEALLLYEASDAPKDSENSGFILPLEESVSVPIHDPAAAARAILAPPPAPVAPSPIVPPAPAPKPAPPSPAPTPVSASKPRKPEALSAIDQDRVLALNGRTLRKGVRLPDGELLPNHPLTATRYQGNVFLSTDEGQNWVCIQDLNQFNFLAIEVVDQSPAAQPSVPRVSVSPPTPEGVPTSKGGFKFERVDPNALPPSGTTILTSPLQKSGGSSRPFALRLASSRIVPLRSKAPEVYLQGVGEKPAIEPLAVVKKVISDTKRDDRGLDATDLFQHCFYNDGKTPVSLYDEVDLFNDKGTPYFGSGNGPYRVVGFEISVKGGQEPKPTHVRVVDLSIQGVHVIPVDLSGCEIRRRRSLLEPEEAHRREFDRTQKQIAEIAGTTCWKEFRNAQGTADLSSLVPLHLYDLLVDTTGQAYVVQYRNWNRKTKLALVALRAGDTALNAEGPWFFLDEGHRESVAPPFYGEPLVRGQIGKMQRIDICRAWRATDKEDELRALGLHFGEWGTRQNFVLKK